MKLAELRDLIRAEAGMNGLDEYVSLIDAILNQELQAITGKSKYQELLVSTNFTAAADNQKTFDLPADFQLISSVNYHASGDNPEVGLELFPGKMSYVQSKISGSPQYYAISGGKITFYPYSSLYLDDYFTFNYYKKPVLIMDDEEFPVPSLEKAVQQAVMARLLRMVDTKRAQMAKAESDRGFIESRAENAANS